MIRDSAAYYKNVSDVARNIPLIASTASTNIPFQRGRQRLPSFVPHSRTNLARDSESSRVCGEKLVPLRAKAGCGTDKGTQPRTNFFFKQGPTGYIPGSPPQ